MMKELIQALRDFARAHDLEALWDAPTERMTGALAHLAIRDLAKRGGGTLGEALDALERREEEDSRELFLASWAWFESELWGMRRWTQPAPLDALGARVKQITLGMPREELEAWAVHHRVSPWLDLPVGYLSAVLYNGWPRLWSPADRWTLAQIICGGDLWIYAKVLPRTTREDALRLLTQVADAYKPPKELPAVEPGTPLAALRAALDAAWDQYAQVMCMRPNVKALYQSTLVDEDAIHDPLVYSSARYHAPCQMEGQPRVRIGQDSSGAVSVRCDCERGAHRPCPMKMEALRAWQEVTARPEAQDRRAALERLLSAPAWQRQLDSLLELLEGEPTVREEEWLGWRVEEQGKYGQLEVKPILVRHKKRQSALTSRQLSQGAVADLLLELPRHAAAERERLRLHLAMQGNMRSLDRTVELLGLLVGHPHVYHQSEEGLMPLELRSDPVVLSLEQEAGRSSAALATSAGPLTETQLAIVRQMPQGAGGVVLGPIQGGAMRLMPVSAQMVRAATKLRGARLELPAEASEYMTRRAQGLVGRADIRLSQNLQGREVKPALKLLARLERTAEGGLSLALRMRPLAGAAAVVPGQQPEILHALTDEGAIFTRRKLGAELTLLERAHTALELEPGQAIEEAWSLGEPDEALLLLERLRDAEQRELLQIEWSQRPMTYAKTDDTQRLQLQVRPADRYFQINGRLELDEQGSIPLPQLLAAAREGRRWVKMGEDQWIKLEGELARSVEQLARALEGSKDMLGLLAAPVLMEIEAQGAHVDAPPKWLQHTAKILAARELNPHAPRGFKATLRPYQREGYVWMMRLASWAPGAVLADDMGLGKTIQALAVLLKRGKDGPALVVAPASVCVNWGREAALFAPQLTIRTLRTGADVEALLTPGANEVVVIGYDLMARHIERLEQVRWATAVLDEAQSFKNASTLRYKAVAKLDAAFRIALTGTPVENHTGELWSVFTGAVPGLLGTQASFVKRFQSPIERDQDPAARAALASLISPFVLRRLKRDVAQELPPRTDIRLDVELSAPELERYEAFRRAALDELMMRGEGGQKGDQAEESDRFAILAAITRLRQLACHPRLVEPKSKLVSSKIELLRERVAELREEGHQALIFSQFVRLLDLARTALEADGVRCASLDGSMSQKQRQTAIDGFQAGEQDVFLLSIKAGGVGLNLTAANFVFLLDPWWNPAVEDQATDRAHRIGQENPVTVYRLVAQGTIEEAIYTMHADKRALMDAVLSESGSAKALSPEELRALISL
jgi:superfamily II DNA or RNA helicase